MTVTFIVNIFANHKEVFSNHLERLVQSKSIDPIRYRVEEGGIIRRETGEIPATIQYSITSDDHSRVEELDFVVRLVHEIYMENLYNAEYQIEENLRNHLSNSIIIKSSKDFMMMNFASLQVNFDRNSYNKNAEKISQAFKKQMEEKRVQLLRKRETQALETERAKNTFEDLSSSDNYQTLTTKITQHQPLLRFQPVSRKTPFSRNLLIEKRTKEIEEELEQLDLIREDQKYNLLNVIDPSIDLREKELLTDMLDMMEALTPIKKDPLDHLPRVKRILAEPSNKIFPPPLQERKPRFQPTDYSAFNFDVVDPKPIIAWRTNGEPYETHDPRIKVVLEPDGNIVYVAPCEISKSDEWDYVFWPTSPNRKPAGMATRTVPRATTPPSVTKSAFDSPETQTQEGVVATDLDMPTQTISQVFISHLNHTIKTETAVQGGIIEVGMGMSTQTAPQEPPLPNARSPLKDGTNTPKRFRAAGLESSSQRRRLTHSGENFVALFLDNNAKRGISR